MILAGPTAFVDDLTCLADGTCLEEVKRRTGSRSDGSALGGVRGARHRSL